MACKYRLFLFLSVCAAACWVVSCANMASPNGGPYDENPPRFLRSTPALHQTGYTGKKIEIVFDELVQIEKPSENVIVTPPQKNLPVIRAAGKKVIVELKDTLQPDITYTIDFTSSISDNNEKNALENFSFAFATGDQLDSLEISGILLNARNLEPMPGVLVGLHENLSDTAFTKLPFYRTSKTNDRGKFTIRNIATGMYRLYALNDANRDYRFDQPGEEIAFLDSVIVPTFVPATRQDTIWKDTVTVDSVRTVDYTRFLPDDVLLRLFKEKFQRQYMLRPERSLDKLFTLKFNAPVDTLPQVELPDEPERTDWCLAQPADSGRSVHYWITDSLVWQRDTIYVKVTYPKSDSLNIPQPQTDTVRLTLRKAPAKSRRKKKDEPEPIEHLTFKVSLSGKANVFDRLSVTFPEPVTDLSDTVFHLEQKQDTLWIPAPFTFRQDSIDLLMFNLDREWKYEEEYRLTIDSAAITSIYGKQNDAYQTAFTMRKRDEYGHLYLNIPDVAQPAFVQLLNKNDAPIRQATVKEGGALFMNLNPDTYYARIILDMNENGEWDTGNYAEKRPPEEVFYSPKAYQVFENFEITETWNVYDTPVSGQKPMEITKNKPKDVTKKKRNYKDESRQRTNRSSGSGFGGVGSPLGF